MTLASGGGTVLGYKFRLRGSFPYSATEKETEWDEFTPSEVDLLDRETVKTKHAPGDFIFRQNDSPSGVFCIVGGYVLLSRTDSFGNETTFGIFGPDETIGHRSFFASDLHLATARAITHCFVYHIPTDTMRQLFESNLELAWWFLRTVASDRGPLDGLLLRGNKVPARVRFIHMLLLLKDRFARTDENGHLVFELPLRRVEIADMLGVTPETITRTIREIQTDNLAIIRGRKIIVPRLDLLERACEPNILH